MPTETMLKYYPENPSYYPETEIDDSMHGADVKMKEAARMPGLVKGLVE